MKAEWRDSWEINRKLRDSIKVSQWTKHFEVGSSVCKCRLKKPHCYYEKVKSDTHVRDCD